MNIVKEFFSWYWVNLINWFNWCLASMKSKNIPFTVYMIISMFISFSTIPIVFISIYFMGVFGLLILPLYLFGFVLPVGAFSCKKTIQWEENWK